MTSVVRVAQLVEKRMFGGFTKETWSREMIIAAKFLHAVRHHQGHVGI